jgi:hypothetical protein
VAIANTSGTITIDCSAGPYQSINMAGNIALSFTSNTWPAAGTLGMVRTQITVDQVGRTLTLPGAVSNGIVGIQGYTSNVITFANTGTYEFGFSTTNAGNAITIVDFNRPLNYYTNGVNIAANTNSTSTTSGALIVAGGIGVAGNLYVGGDIFGNVTVTDISVGTITAAGNVVGGNINTAGLITATGNVTGGNFNTAGLISATANIVGGNLNATGLSLSGNVVSALNASTTIVAGTTMSAVGNITGGNLRSVSLSLSGNVISALNVTGNIAGGNVIIPGIISSVGNITGGNIRTAGQLVAASGSAIAAGGTQSLGLEFSTTADFGVFFGSGAPTISAAKGSLYLRSDGSTTNNRMYVNTDGATAWTAVTTAS